MIKRFLLIIPIIIFGYLTINNLKSTNNGCYGLAEVIAVFFFGILTVLYTVLIILIAFLRAKKKGRNFDYTSLIAFVFVILIGAVIIHLDSDRYDSMILIESRYYDGEKHYGTRNIHLKLRESGEYNLLNTGTEFGCIETGKYENLHDTIILIRPANSENVKFDYEQLLLNKENGRIYVMDNEGFLDTTKYFRIE